MLVNRFDGVEATSLEWHSPATLSFDRNLQAYTTGREQLTMCAPYTLRPYFNPSSPPPPPPEVHTCCRSGTCQGCTAPCARLVGVQVTQLRCNARELDIINWTGFCTDTCVQAMAVKMRCDDRGPVILNWTVHDSTAACALTVAVQIAGLHFDERIVR